MDRGSTPKFIKQRLNPKNLNQRVRKKLNPQVFERTAKICKGFNMHTNKKKSYEEPH